MTFRNVHERVFRARPEQVGALIDSLASADDRPWPKDKWPPMRLDGGLAVGSRGGHGPVRYFVESYEPGREVVFRFIGPRGFRGTHRYGIHAPGAGEVALRHELEISPLGPALVTWPVFFRPLHDAALEDSLDTAEQELFGRVRAPQKWSGYVRFLRWVVQRLPRRSRGRANGARSAHVT